MTESTIRNSTSHYYKASRSIGERLDQLSWSRFHTRITMVLGIGWLLDSFEVSIIGNVLSILKKLWNLTAVQASAMVSVWLAGIMIGALFFGYLADRYGRRKLFLATLLLYSSCTVVSAISPGYGFFMVFRFLTAIGVGAEYSAINSAIGELIPARVRGRATALVMNFWPLGSILAALASLLLLPYLPVSIGWRVAFGMGAGVALFTLWARRMLPESPRWLVSKGRSEEAEAITRNMEGASASIRPSGSSLQRQSSQAGFFRQVLELIRRYPGRLALGTLLDFTESAGYYGIFAFLPLEVLPRLHIKDAHIPWFFLVGNFGAVAGGLAVVLLLDRAGRKLTVTLAYSLAAASMILMGWQTLSGSADGVLWTFIGVNFFATMSWVSAYPTFSELLPTEFRSTGIGFSVAVGHIGAAVAPLLLIETAQHSSLMASFVLLAGFYLTGALCMIPWILKGPEGKGKSLEQLSSANSRCTL